VITLLADANITGHVAHLVARMQGEPWRGYWDYLDLRWLIFQDVGLDPADTDAVVWHKCQEQHFLLLTNNRNEDGPDSLETTIRTCNTLQSLPVFTVGDADSILTSAAYADRVIDRLFRHLFEIDNLVGTGRLYLP
jgi:hypothetical protein